LLHNCRLAAKEKQSGSVYFSVFVALFQWKQTNKKQQKVKNKKKKHGGKKKDDREKDFNCG
jgi:hypothetical protein